MTDTRLLIEQLAARAAPVRPLPAPWRRASRWIALVVAVVAAMTVISGPRPDLLGALSAPAAAVEWLASALTGLFAAYAVFQISVPGRSPRWAWLPVPPLAVWVGGLSLGCLGDWSRLGLQAFAFDSHGAECFGVITMISLPLILILLLMVRHAGAVRPALTALLGALSAAALSAAGVSLIHDGETALMVLLWHVGAIALLVLLVGLFNRRLFAWIGHNA
ncbi:MAG TPA: NrsF family protein [Lysobacter sp.]|jgi:hypothetical protein|nr:NrsF family protein [Lysobacter sp.]